jgi:hypothetical protein
MIALMAKRLTLPAHLCFGYPVAGLVTGRRACPGYAAFGEPAATEELFPALIRAPLGKQLLGSSLLLVFLQKLVCMAEHNLPLTGRPAYSEV